jgi:glycosyltransferase involved in cell wall biosynthesis
MSLLKVLLADPSLFTAPYDAALSEGLRAGGVVPTWAVRALRKGEDRDLLPEETRAFFYRYSDGSIRRGRALKGVEHFYGMVKLSKLARQGRFDVVHLQWSMIPLVDQLFVQRLRRHCPVVMTVHDTTLFNGASVSFMQRAGYVKMLASVDQIIVHTEGARGALAADGVDPGKVSVIPHGKLSLRFAVQDRPLASAQWKVVLFGRLQSYKGADTLVEALARIDAVNRERLSVVIAGEPLMPIEPLQNRVAELKLDNVVDIRPWRHCEAEMAALLHQADCFVFPYRAIEASGVFFLVADLGKWIIASDLGAFRDLLGQDGEAGRLVRPDDPSAFADAICDSIGRVPTSSCTSSQIGWSEIGLMTRDVYERAINARAARNPSI